MHNAFLNPRVSDMSKEANLGQEVNGIIHQNWISMPPLNMSHPKIASIPNLPQK
jgi:hypothetical protein